MNHDAIQELLALRLYGEVTADETTLVERHLAECADCRRLAAELDAGLGRLITERPARASAPAARRRRAVGTAGVVLGAVLGFAAGVVLTWALTATAARPVVPANTRGPVGDPMVAGLDLQEAPPPATSAGRLAMLGRYVGR